MRNHLNALMVFAVILFSGCSSEDAPKDVINDEEGILIDLKWTTGGTEQQALEQTDLDLYIFDQGSEEIVSSQVSDQFEKVFFEAFYDEGQYTVEVQVNSVTQATDCFITVKGFGSEETIQRDFSINADTESGTKIVVLNISKKGNKFTLTKPKG
jgi:PBP1b-binding outer membrane lipoprotein LpoB